MDFKSFLNSGKKIYKTKPTLANNFSLGPKGFYGLLRLFLKVESPPEAGKIWRNSPIFGLKPLLRENHADLKFPLLYKRCGYGRGGEWPEAEILDFARSPAGTNGPFSGGLARLDSGYRRRSTFNEVVP